jgi:hypothetical protein
VDKAISAYKSNASFKADTARAKFWKSKTLRLLKRDEEADIEATESFEQYQLLTEDPRPMSSLTEQDYDSIVVFWSR